jgi:hypothetical protein
LEGGPYEVGASVTTRGLIEWVIGLCRCRPMVTHLRLWMITLMAEVVGGPRPKVPVYLQLISSSSGVGHTAKICDMLRLSLFERGLDVVIDSGDGDQLWRSLAREQCTRDPAERQVEGEEGISLEHFLLSCFLLPKRPEGTCGGRAIDTMHIVARLHAQLISPRRSISLVTSPFRRISFIFSKTASAASYRRSWDCV